MKNLKQKQPQEDHENGMGLTSIFRAKHTSRLNEKAQAYGGEVLRLEMHDWYGSEKDLRMAEGA